MTERDIKLLWGRSGNRCAICKIELSQDKKLSSQKYPLGEQAHIVGDKESAARGKSNLSDEERDGYSNRILLCPSHHTEIDKDEQFYSVERLYVLKQQLEFWVQERLSEHADNKNQVADLIYSSLIDAAVRYLDFQNWNSWAGLAGHGLPSWRDGIVDGVEIFEDSIFRANWPNSNPELEAALKTLSQVVTKAQNVFLKYAKREYRKNIYEAVTFYKLKWHNDESVYHKLLKQYQDWEFECAFWIWMTTKAANWVCDVVRRDINPMFFTVEGRFVFSGFIKESYNCIPEFTVAEKAAFPNGINQLFEDYKKQHPSLEEE